MEMSAPAGLLNSRPPRLEDAGLEDCALPAHAIQEAFRRAADAMRNASSAASGMLSGTIGTEECGHNPGPTNGSWEDKCLDPTPRAVLGEESCVDTKAGGLIEEGHDLLVQGGDGDLGGDRIVVGTEAGPKLGQPGCDGDSDDAPVPDKSEGGPILIGAVM